MLSTPLRYAVAVAACAVALALNLLLQPFVGANTFPFFLAAVMLATWAGGLGPGLLATVLGVLAILFVFVLPLGPGVPDPGSAAVRLTLFVGSAVLIAVLAARLREAQERAQSASRQAEAARAEAETARRQAEAALIEAEQARERAEQREAAERVLEEERRHGELLFRALLESVAEYSIAMLDPEGRVISWNAGGERILGYADAEILGQDFSRFHTPEDIAAGLPRQALERAARDGRYVEQGWRVRKDGTRFFADVAVSAAHDASGALRGFTKVIHDITERRRAEQALRASEQRFRGLLELAPDGILLVARDGRIVLANTQAHAIFRYGQDELPGQPIEVLVPDRMRDAHGAHRAAYHDRPRPRPMGLGLDLSGRRKDGSEVPVEISLSPLDTPDGQLVISVVRDISERKRVEARIRVLNADLERRIGELAAVNRELEAFSYSVSHDLRGPLRAIDGFSLALVEEYTDRLDDAGRDYLGRIRAAAQRMGELIDDLLALSRVTRREMRRERVDLSALARDILAQLAAAEPGREVQAEVADGLVAHGDPHLLRIALENLVGNAWKFTRPRTPARIEVGATGSDGAAVYFIRDNGVGFDLAHADKLFGAFQRLHAMHEFPGTGIGLATVLRIVQRHGGRVWPEACRDKGATFYFTLGETG